MVKKGAKKRTIKKTTIEEIEETSKPRKKAKRKTSPKKTTASKETQKLNEILVENFVSLQKAVTNLTIKFDSLSDQISKLLQLFEISAKSFAEKLTGTTPQVEKDREFLDKLNKLLDQNKVIAKGLTLMEEKMRERIFGGHPTPAYPPQRNPTPTEGYAQGLGKRRPPAY